MASIRIGFSSDFVLKNGVVGLGTTVGSTTDGKLEIGSGVLRADFSVTGVTTLTAYGGFVAQKQHVNKPAAIGFGTVGLQTAGVGTAYQYYETETGFTDLGGVHHGDDQYFNTLSEDLVIDDGQILNITNTDMVGVTTIGEYDPHNHSSYVCAGSLEQVSVTGHFSVPNGGINDRQLTPIEGTVRFNDDLNTLEFFNGNEWRQFTYNQGQSGRGVFGGGQSPTFVSLIDYVNVTTFGNAVSFGDMVASSGNSVRSGCASASSSTRGIFLGGGSPTRRNDCDYITLASGGNGVDFGNLTELVGFCAGTSSSTRGLRFGGATPSPTNTVNTIDYVQIATTGDAVNFGDLTEITSSNGASSSPTRAVRAGGNNGGMTGVIDFVTIASTGDAVKFGDLTEDRQGARGNVNSSTRGVFGGGRIVAPGNITVTTIDYITFASEGNAIDFGNITTDRQGAAGACTQIRGLFAGGAEYSPSTAEENVIDFIMIASTGNGQDFGDLTDDRQFAAGLSDSHGGLGGF